MQRRSDFSSKPGKSTRTTPAPTPASPGPMPMITTTSGRTITTRLSSSRSRWPTRPCASIPAIIKLSGHLGWAYLYNRQHEKAVAHYARARGLNPNDAELLAEMANFLIFVGQPKQAIEQVTQAIRLNPFHESWYLEYLGWAYEEAGMPEKAIETLRTNHRSANAEGGPALRICRTLRGRLRPPCGWADGRRAQDSHDAPGT